MGIKLYSEITQKARKSLVVASLIGFIIFYVEIVINKINIFGIEIIFNNNDALPLLVFFIMLYFLFVFVFYALSEETAENIALNKEYLESLEKSNFSTAQEIIEEKKLSTHRLQEEIKVLEKLNKLRNKLARIDDEGERNQIYENERDYFTLEISTGNILADIDTYLDDKKKYIENEKLKVTNLEKKLRLYKLLSVKLPKRLKIYLYLRKLIEFYFPILFSIIVMICLLFFTTTFSKNNRTIIKSEQTLLDKKDIINNCTLKNMTLSINPNGRFTLRGRLVNDSNVTISELSIFIEIFENTDLIEKRLLKINLNKDKNLLPKEVRGFEFIGNLEYPPQREWNWKGQLYSVNNIQLKINSLDELDIIIED